MALFPPFFCCMDTILFRSSEEDLDEEDLDLMEENTGVKIRRPEVRYRNPTLHKRT